MIGTLSQNASENLAGMTFFLALAFVASWIAGTAGYYRLPYRSHKGTTLLFQDICVSFFIFIVVYFLVLPPILLHLFHSLYSQLIIFVLTAIFLFSYATIRHINAIWKDPSFPGNRSYLGDIKFGLISWLVAMPVVASISYIMSLVIPPTNQEQIAVQFLKNYLNDPLTMAIALFSIVLAAPLFEEYLFRGLLLSYIRNKLGPITAVFLSAAIFALFHFAPSQANENIPLIATLFAFGSYLGFAYEKTRSLITSIVLHVTFNSISVIRIIFNGT